MIPRIEVRTSEFQFEHGRAPRGRGSWAFQFSFKRPGDYDWSPSMTYSEAKRWAVARVRSLVIENPLLNGVGAIFIEVQP